MYKLGLTFDERRFMDDLIIHLSKCVYEVSTKLISDMKQKADNEKIGNSWVNDVYKIGSEHIIAIVGNSHWWAFIDNYGSGSKMAKANQNPFLEQYIANKDYFYSERTNHSNSVLVRPKGTYEVPNWDKGSGTTTDLVKGKSSHLWKDGTPKNLELMKDKNKNPRFKAQSPKFWFDDEFKAIEKNFADAISKSLDTFPFDSDKYLKGV